MELGKETNQDTSPTSKPLMDKPKESWDNLMKMVEQDLEKIDLEKLEESFNRKDFQTIPVEQLIKVHKVFI